MKKNPNEYSSIAQATRHQGRRKNNDAKYLLVEEKDTNRRNFADLLFCRRYTCHRFQSISVLYLALAIMNVRKRKTREGI